MLPIRTSLCFMNIPMGTLLPLLALLQNATQFKVGTDQVQSILQAPLQEVASYYDGRVREFGPTPWGVDWTCELTQQLRFVQLLKVAGRRKRFSLNDLGCGYG